MIYRDIEFHNVEELEEKNGMSGVFLQRFPKATRNAFGYMNNERGRFFAQNSAGCEIRFVTPSPILRITLSSWESDGNVNVFVGNFFHSSHKIEKGKMTTIHLEYPDIFRAVDPSAFKGHRFSSNVWRICFDKNSCYCFHDIDTFGNSVRPPIGSEKPSKTLLVYGSSISMGGGADKYNNCFVERAGRTLNFDVLNKSVAGACYIDNSLVEYITKVKDWDFVLLELGINMVSRFSPTEFEKRVVSLLHNMMQFRKPMFVTNLITCINLFSLNENLKQKSMLFSRIVEREVGKLNAPNLVHFIEGRELLPDFSCLSCDLVHPADDGHTVMAENLSKIIKAYL